MNNQVFAIEGMLAEERCVIIFLQNLEAGLPYNAIHK